MADDISKNVLTDFQDKTEQLKASVAQLSQYLEELKKKQVEMGNGVAKYSDEFKKGAINIKETQKALKDFNAQITENNKTLLSAKGSLQQNKDLLVDLEDRYEVLSRSQGDNAKQVKDLNVQIGHLSATIDKQEEKVEKSRKVFDYHAESVKALDDAFNKIKTSNEAFGPILDEVTEGFNAMKTGVAAVKTGLQSVDGAIKTTGFGLLMLVLKSLVEYFTKNSEGVKKLHGAMAVIGKVVGKVNETFGKLGGIIVDALSHPMDSLKKIGDFLKENLINRFKAIGVILDGIIHLDFKKIGDGLIQSVSGVTNATDKIKTAYSKTKEAIVAGGKAIVETYKKGVEESGKAAKSQEELDKEKEERLAQQQRKKEERQRKQAEAIERAKQKHATDVKDMKAVDQVLNDLETQTQARNAQKLLTQYDNDVKAIKDFYKEKLGAYEKFIKDYEEKAAKDPEYKKLNAHSYDKAQTAVVTLKTNEAKELETLSDNFQQSELYKLTAYENKLYDIAANAKKTTRDLAIAHVDEKYKAEEEEIKKVLYESTNRLTKLQGLNPNDPITQKKIEQEIAIQTQGERTGIALDNQKTKEKNNIKSDFDIKDTQESITENEANGHHNAALTQQLVLLKMQHDAAVKAAEDTGKATTAIDENYAKKKAAIEDQLTQAKIHAGDKYIDAVLKNTKKDSAIYKAAFMAKKATSIADTIISTKRAVLESLKAYSGIPFIGQALGIAQAAFMAGQGALSIAEIAKQKPGFAAGGQYVSDGRGAILPGYSRNDNTNAYLRSGEAVVVSEAMRNPWARNLVSAINVAHGGRDFSMPNTGRGYAIGGIFTDGGNANRYYNQPINDIKDMANTLAYQMINNFPPIYVDVKDVNNQQNILAQTVNRVNL